MTVPELTPQQQRVLDVICSGGTIPAAVALASDLLLRERAMNLTDLTY
jgi:hypothetical protein